MAECRDEQTVARLPICELAPGQVGPQLEPSQVNWKTLVGWPSPLESVRRVWAGPPPTEANSCVLHRLLYPLPGGLECLLDLRRTRAARLGQVRPPASPSAQDG